MPPLGTSLGDDRLRLPAAAGGRAPRHAGRAGIAEVGFLRSAPRVGKGETHGRAFSFVDFPAALVTDENGLPSQIALLLLGIGDTERSENVP